MEMYSEIKKLSLYPTLLHCDAIQPECDKEVSKPLQYIHSADTVIIAPDLP